MQEKATMPVAWWKTEKPCTLSLEMTIGGQTTTDKMSSYGTTSEEASLSTFLSSSECWIPELFNVSTKEGMTVSALRALRPLDLQIKDSFNRAGVDATALYSPYLSSADTYISPAERLSLRVPTPRNGSLESTILMKKKDNSLDDLMLSLIIQENMSKEMSLYDM